MVWRDCKIWMLLPPFLEFGWLMTRTNVEMVHGIGKPPPQQERLYTEIIMETLHILPSILLGGLLRQCHHFNYQDVYLIYDDVETKGWHDIRFLKDIEIIKMCCDGDLHHRLDTCRYIGTMMKNPTLPRTLHWWKVFSTCWFWALWDR